MKNCLFCNINEVLIFENKYFYSVFDIHPVSPGHALIIPKRHLDSILNLSKEEWEYLQVAISGTIKNIEKTNFKKLYNNFLKKELSEKSVYFSKKMLSHIGINKKPDAYNIGNNDGDAAGRTINHLHIQIIPRYYGDIDNPIGGIRNIIPDLGNYK
ncbi:MAG: HIT family protein [Candidatus Gracilibacteria bacterium]|nr:HIT family protein [Candidatus Gracilibacteria bacterium]